MTNFTPGDTPISKEDQDELQVKPRIVNKILKLLENEQISALTLAVTGEWGVGKSSAMNLLSNALNNPAKTVIIRFEPLLEGRFEVIEILELFYLKLYAALHKKGFKKVKPIIVNILSSLGSLALDGTKLSVGIPKVGSAELNLKKKYNKLLKIWRKKKLQVFLITNRRIK